MPYRFLASFVYANTQHVNWLHINSYSWTTPTKSGKPSSDIGCIGIGRCTSEGLKQFPLIIKGRCTNMHERCQEVIKQWEAFWNEWKPNLLFHFGGTQHSSALSLQRKCKFGLILVSKHTIHSHYRSITKHTRLSYTSQTMQVLRNFKHYGISWYILDNYNVSGYFSFKVW